MIEGPYKSNRWLERLQNIEGVSLIAMALGGICNFVFVAFELWMSQEFVRFSLIVAGTSVFGALAFVRAGAISMIALVLFTILVATINVWI
jgi:hypothetical protein